MKPDVRGDADVSVLVRAMSLTLLSVLAVIAANLGLFGWLRDHLPGL